MHLYRNRKTKKKKECVRKFCTQVAVLLVVLFRMMYINSLPSVPLLVLIAAANHISETHVSGLTKMEKFFLYEFHWRGNKSWGSLCITMCDIFSINSLYLLSRLAWDWGIVVVYTPLHSPKTKIMSSYICIHTNHNDNL